MGRRTKARECAFQILYQWEISGEPITRVLGLFWQVRSGTAAMRGMAERLAKGAHDRVAEIDAAIAEAAANWRLDRIAPVDRTILRLGAYELAAEPQTPSAVVLDEAVELAKRFGEADSPAFVNGVLDAVRRKMRGGAARDGPRARGESKG
jgi:N utilization substance protein B